MAVFDANRIFALSLSVGSTLCTPSAVFGQSIELGGSLGTGARGTESKLVRQEARLTRGFHVSAWWADRFETAFRVVWLDSAVDQFRNILRLRLRCPAERCVPGVLRIESHRLGDRRFAAGQAVYHFRSGHQLRPYLGLGIGTIQDHERVSCVTPGCEALLPGLQLGERRYRYRDVSLISGLSTTFWDRVVVRGGVVFHRPGGENLSLFETSAQIGYRLRLW